MLAAAGNRNSEEQQVLGIEEQRDWIDNRTESYLLFFFFLVVSSSPLSPCITDSADSAPHTRQLLHLVGLNPFGSKTTLLVGLPNGVKIYIKNSNKNGALC